MHQAHYHRVRSPSLAGALAFGATCAVAHVASAHDDPIHASHNLMHSCADVLEAGSLTIHRGIPVGHTSAVIPSWYTGAGNAPANVGAECSGLNWVRLFGGPNLTVKLTPQLGTMPVDEHDCNHTTLTWGLYAQTLSGSWEFVGGGGQYGGWNNGVCSYSPNVNPLATDWGSDTVTNSTPSSTGRYMLAFSMWQHNDVNIGHEYNYCADPISCYWPVKVDLSGVVHPRHDYTIWRPSTGVWWRLDTTTWNSDTVQWGVNGDQPVAFDFDGDGASDYAVFRPSTGQWWIRRSSGTSNWWYWGVDGDVPVTADFDGDARGDMSIWRPSDGRWWIVRTSSWTYINPQWGLSGDVPAAADYTGDGQADLMVWRPSNGTWYMIDSTTGASSTQQWGLSGDIPVPGDYDGDQISDRAVWRPSNGRWYWINSSTGGKWYKGWGLSGDIPVPGDDDSDGKTDKVVWRPSNGRWYNFHSTNNQGYWTQWGLSGDIPLSTIN